MTDRMFGPPEEKVTVLGKFQARVAIAENWLNAKKAEALKSVKTAAEPFIYATMARLGSRRIITEPSAGGFHEKGSGR